MLLKNSDFELKWYIGLDQNQEIELQMPLNFTLFDIDAKKALERRKPIDQRLFILKKTDKC